MCIFLYKYRLNKTCFSFTDFLEKRAEFPLFLDAPDNTSCRNFIKIQQFIQQSFRMINLYKQRSK
ncbi:hypothetical protein Hanom_Chr13g01184081 [Helianthus anomalus]